MDRIPDYDSFEFIISEPHEATLESQLIKQMVKGSSKWAVDLGCGYGRLSSLVSAHYDNLILMDYSIRGLNRARDNVTSKNVFFVACDIRHPPIVDSSIDLILMIRVFHHFKHPETAIGKIAQKIRSGGEIILNFNNSQSLPVFLAVSINKIFHTNLLNLKINLFSRETQEVTECGCNRPIYFNSFSNVRGIMKAHGLEISDVIGVGLAHNSWVEKSITKFNLKRVISFELNVGKLPLIRTLSPDVFASYRRPEEIETDNNISCGIFDILRCPACAGKLQNENGLVRCVLCNSNYRFINGILDLRLDNTVVSPFELSDSRI